MPLDEHIARLGTDADPTKARSIPRELYLHEDMYSREVERIFREEWIAIARSDELAGVGDYLCAEVFGEPVVVVRNDAGELAALSNVCRHRSMPIAQGTGCARRLVCPYHRWSYGLDGQLEAAPAMERAPGFDRRDVALPRFALEQWQGWVFICLNPSAKPLATRLAALDALLEPHAISDMRLAATLHFDSPWNWKVMVENFMESYHHIGPHAQTLQPLTPAFDTHVLDVDGPLAVLDNPGKTDDIPPFWAICVFPYHLFAVSRGAVPFTLWYQMRIRRRDYFDLDIKLLLPPDSAANPDVVEALRATADMIHREDIPVCEGVQRGLSSRHSTPGRLNPLERANWLFQKYLGQQLRRADS